ncbi:MAG: hypothetical protein K8R88_13730 [Armatimonadetes bacterium]|nr:hypothetical protein [Armatimonadota bacterium]
MRGILNNQMRQLALIILCLSVFGGCTPRGPKTPAEPIGEYVFPVRNGDVEVIILQANFAYRHELYSSIDSYRQGSSPVYTNTGTWYYKGNTLGFSEWVEFINYLQPIKRTEPPEPVAKIDCGWVAPTRHADAILLFSESANYLFLRVKDRHEGARILTEATK